MKSSLFGVAMKMLFAKKQRLILTCIGVAISIGLIIVISSLYNSMEQNMQKAVEDEYGTFNLMVGYSPVGGMESRKFLEKEDISKILSMDGVVDSGIAILAPELATNNIDIERKKKDGINYNGVEPSRLMDSIMGVTNPLQVDGVVITEDLAKYWGVGQGEETEIYIDKDRTLRKIVSEIIPSAPAGPTLILHIDAVREAYELGDVANAVYLELAEGISDKLMEERIRTEIDPNIDVYIVSQDVDVLKQRSMIRVIAFGLGSIVLAVCILFITSSFRLMMRGRVRELSTFRMIGASEKVISKMVMMEAAVLNLIGVAVGLIVGIGFSHIASLFITSIMGVSLSGVELDWRLLMVVAASSWLILTLSVMRVAVTTAGTAPLVAIRQSEQEKIHRSVGWLAGSLIILGITIMCLAWFGLIGNDESQIFMLLGGFIVAGGCLVGTGYMIPVVTQISGTIMGKLNMSEAYYGMKQFISLRKQNMFIVMLLASIVTALVVIPTFIDNLNKANTENAIRKYITPIVIENSRDVMSPNTIEQVMQIDGVAQALPMGNIQEVLLGDIDFSKADQKWLQHNSYLTSKQEYTALDTTFEYERFFVIKTDLKRMQSMGLLEVSNEELTSGVVLQPIYAEQIGLAQGDIISLQRTYLGKKTNQYDVPVSGVSNISFTTLSKLALVDSSNPQTAWIGNEYGNNQLMPRTIYVQVDPNAEIAAVKQRLKQLFDNQTVMRVTDLDTELLRIADNSKEQRMIMWAGLLVFILVAIIGVMNTLGATFHSHRREYAILRAIHLTARKLRTVMIIQGMLYAITSIFIGILASIWIVLGLFGIENEFGSWSINWYTIALPIVIVITMSLVISFIYSRQIGTKSIIEELSIE